MRVTLKLACLIVPLSLLASAGAASAGPAGMGMDPAWDLLWQSQHDVNIRVASLGSPYQRQAVVQAVRAVSGVQRVDFDAKRLVIRAVPVVRRLPEPDAVRAAVAATGYDIVEPAPGERE